MINYAFDAINGRRYARSMTRRLTGTPRKLLFKARSWARERFCRIIDQVSLRELRNARGLSQQMVATEMGTLQSEISRIEQRSDIHIATLRAYIEASGGKLKILAVFPHGSYIIDQF